MNRQGLGLVLEQLEKDIGAFLGGSTDKVKFDLALMNGTHTLNKNSVMLYICGTDEVEIIEGQGETVEEGFRKIVAQLRAPLSQGPPDLSRGSLEAVTNLMWEVAEIAADMSAIEPKLGLHHGPDFGILLGRACCFFEGSTGVRISFWEVQERFADINPANPKARDCHFEATGENILDALEAVIDKAYLRIKEAQ